MRKPPFSLRCGGRDFCSDLVQPVCAPNEEREEYLVDGLRLVRTFKRLGAGLESLLTLENTLDTPSPLIENICDLDLRLALPAETAAAGWTGGGAARLITARGSDWSREEFSPGFHRLSPGTHLSFAPQGGRSSQGTLPFFDVNLGEKGWIVAVGWTGQWHAGFVREGDALRVTVGVEDAAFFLYPGERVRTASVFLLPYEGDCNRGHNALRQAILQASGRTSARAPFAVSFWGGGSSGYIARSLQRISAAGLPCDLAWIDAGWHGTAQACSDDFNADWGRETGDWRINLSIHPDGLAEVVRSARDAGMGLLLWMEPERSYRDAPLCAEHPDWFLMDPDDPYRNLLDLGNPLAVEYIFGRICQLIEQLGLSCFRQDFNIDPLPLWQAADEPGRRGVRQLKHIAGLYALWDRLLAKYPGLLIDNCASGGRRIDWETLKRSLPLWRSDFQCSFDASPEAAQNHGAGLSWWIPVSGTGTAVEPGSLYDLRSAYAAALNLRWFTYEGMEQSALSPELIAMADEYAQIRELFSGDFYPVFGFGTQDTSWGGWQYHSSAREEGIVCAFRRPESVCDHALVPLGGLCAEADYRVSSFDGEPAQVRSGRELAERGLPIRIDNRKESRLYRYERLPGPEGPR